MGNLYYSTNFTLTQLILCFHIQILCFHKYFIFQTTFLEKLNHANVWFHPTTVCLRVNEKQLAICGSWTRVSKHHNLTDLSIAPLRVLYTQVNYMLFWEICHLNFHNLFGCNCSQINQRKTIESTVFKSYPLFWTCLQSWRIPIFHRDRSSSSKKRRRKKLLTFFSCFWRNQKSICHGPFILEREKERDMIKRLFNFLEVISDQTVFFLSHHPPTLSDVQEADDCRTRWEGQ